MFGIACDVRIDIYACFLALKLLARIAKNLRIFCWPVLAAVPNSDPTVRFGIRHLSTQCSALETALVGKLPRESIASHVISKGCLNP